MKRLLVGILSLLIIAGCSTDSGTNVEATEFDSAMKEAYDILNKEFKSESGGQISDKEDDRLSYLLYDKEYDIELGTEEYSFYQAIQMYEAKLSTYNLGASSYSELVEAKEEADSYFE